MTSQGASRHVATSERGSQWQRERASRSEHGGFMTLARPVARESYPVWG